MVGCLLSHLKPSELCILSCEKGRGSSEIHPIHSCEHVTLAIFQGVSRSHSTGGGPTVVVSTAAFHARVLGSVPGLDGLKETKKCFFPIHVRKSVLWGASVTER